MTGHEQRHPVAQAAHAIQVAGHVQLPGAPALRTKVLGVLIVILMILVALLACGGVVFAAAAFMTGVRLTIATLIGLITVLGLLTVVFLCLVSAKRRQAQIQAGRGASCSTRGPRAHTAWRRPDPLVGPRTSALHDGALLER